MKSSRPVEMESLWTPSALSRRHRTLSQVSHGMVLIIILNYKRLYSNKVLCMQGDSQSNLSFLTTCVPWAVSDWKVNWLANFSTVVTTLFQLQCVTDMLRTSVIVNLPFKVEKCHVAVIQGGLHLAPPRHILSKLVLVGQRHHMHVGRNVNVEHFKMVLLAQVISYTNKTGGPSLGYPVVYDH